MTNEEIKNILENHKHWVREDTGGWEKMRANLREADLRGANLRGADLWGANLRGAEINENTKINLPISCPDTGAFTAWKKARGYIIQLEIPAKAKRLSATGRKCRCNMAKVVAIQNIDGTDSGLSEVRSNYAHDFIYKVGETVVVDDFDDNRWNECSTGIHFFITREEAVDY